MSDLLLFNLFLILRIRGIPKMTYEFDGVMISDIIIDVELKRTKGRVTREEAKHLALVANEIRKERDQYKALFEAAKNYIDEDPGSRDTSSKQIKLWMKYCDLLTEYEKGD